MILLLVRHGETPWNGEQRCQGHSDIELNELGIRQARALARSLGKEPLVAVYSSPLKRALQTAQEIAHIHQLTVNVEEGIKEINQGDYEGLTAQELFQNHADFLEKWLKEPAHLKIPNGESMREVQERAWRTIERIASRHEKGSMVVVVSHNLCISTVLCKALNLDLNDFRRVRQDVGALHCIEIDEMWPNPVLTMLNHTYHLKEL